MFWKKANYDRIKRYFAGTFIHVKEVSNEYLYVRDVTPNFVRMYDKDDNVFEINLITGYNLSYVLPTNRITFQHGGRAHILIRAPLRQYRRGICEDNSTLYSIGIDGKLSYAEIKFEVLNSILNKMPYKTLTQAYAAFASKSAVSVALSHRFSVTARGRLLLDSVVIGYVNFKKDYIKVLPAYAAVVTSLVNNTKDPFNIIVKAQ